MRLQTLLWQCEKCLEEGLPDREWCRYAPGNPTTIQFGNQVIEVCALRDVESTLIEEEVPVEKLRIN